MKIALRGEGPTDIGALDNGVFTKGPMVILIEKLSCYQSLLNNLGFSEELNINDFIEWEYIDKYQISQSQNSRKKAVLRGKKRQSDALDNTSVLKSFYKNSESFGYLANLAQADLAIFFVDTDKDSFEQRYSQVKAGLSKHGLDKRGIAMIPVRISESWLMCCLSEYHNCSVHECATTDQESPKYPKNVCEASGFTRHEIAQKCDSNKINMPSFNKFRDDFQVAINDYMGYKVCE